MAWIPEPIYKTLPAAYTVAGVALLAAFGLDGPAALSALMLFSAAGLTAWWRYQHREDIEPEVPLAQSRAKEEWAQRRARGSDPLRYK